MPSDTSIVRLLYAILSQKCLKDINWDKVAQDPILSQEISNGHAARMRYSRFKKQIEASTVALSSSHSSSSSTTAASRKARKSRIVKTKQRKRDAHVKEESPENEDAAATSFESRTSANSARDLQTPEPEMVGALPVNMGLGTRIETQIPNGSPEHFQMQYYEPATPVTTSFSTPTTSHRQYPSFVPEGSPSPSPNSSYNFTANFQDSMVGNNAYHSFDSHASLAVGTLPEMSNGLFGEVASAYDSNGYEDWPQQHGFTNGWIPQESIEAVKQRLDALIEHSHAPESPVAGRVNVKQEPSQSTKN